MQNGSQERTVILTDDHPIVRHAIKTILESSQNYRVIAEADNADRAIELVKKHEPDYLVLDISLPGKSGIEALYELNGLISKTKVIVLSMFDDELKVKQAVSAGAFAYITKGCSPQEFIAALNRVEKNQQVVPKGYEHLLDNGSSEQESSDPLAKLSKREREVFYLLAEGLPNRVIAKKLFISARTVETHRARVLTKLGFSSTADLIRFAIRNGLIGT